jgi:UDP-N-acetylglucosamine 2-epimerase
VVERVKFNKENIINPYKKKNTSKKIISIIENINLEKYKNKKFYDRLCQK